jgi:predicted transcriptional regulator
MTKISRPPLSAQSIEALLKVAPRSNEELRKLTGYSRAGVTNQLERMELAGLVHRERLNISRAAGFLYIWHSGPAKDGSTIKPAPLERAISGMTPRQKTVRQYESINRRDELVAALFGQAGSAQ